MPSPSVLPSVEIILTSPESQACIATWGHQVVKLGVRHLQNGMRASGEIPGWSADPHRYGVHLQRYLLKTYGHGIRRVFNLTGTLIHTNLGRAALSHRMIDAGLVAATHAVTLEFDLATGKRGQRERFVEGLLCALTGAEAATVVNNNAAALLLVLNSLALNKEVPVSRGELIEIGGSFRLPEIMTRAGCHLKEVGTTNRTHESDYRSAIDVNTSLLLKIHPSNYHIEGFTKEVALSSLAKLARSRQLPLCVDLGSGALVDLARYGLPQEPVVRDILSQGADLVTFSGDKLLGSVQAGIVVGRRKWVEPLRTNPLKRALRCDKITLAILAETLKIYQDSTQLEERIPLLRMLTCSIEWLTERANEVVVPLRQALDAGCQIDIRPSQCQIGSGALPDKTIASIAVCIRQDSASRSMQLLKNLRALPTPVIARLTEGAVWLDLRTLAGNDDTPSLIENLALLQL